MNALAAKPLLLERDYPNAHINTVISEGRVALVDVRQKALNEARFRATWVILGFALVATVALAQIARLGIAEKLRRASATGLLPPRGDIVDRNGVPLARAFQCTWATQRCRVKM